MINHIFWSLKRHQLVLVWQVNEADLTDVEVTPNIAKGIGSQKVGSSATKITY